MCNSFCRFNILFLDILGRDIHTQRCAKGVAWFGFTDICDGPRSQQDYIEIARWYPTVIVSGLPQLTSEREDQARRFISLVDEFYDRKVKLLLSADTAIDSLYTGDKLKFEFQRTASRLVEMQSTRAAQRIESRAASRGWLPPGAGPPSVRNQE